MKVKLCMDSLDKLQLLHNLKEKKKILAGLVGRDSLIFHTMTLFIRFCITEETKKNFIALLTLKEPVMFFRRNLILQKRKDFTDLKWGYFVVIFNFFYWFCLFLIRFNLSMTEIQKYSDNKVTNCAVLL